jgi:hypothetical protein
MYQCSFELVHEPREYWKYEPMVDVLVEEL